MQTVTMYTGAFCPYCTMAKKLLHSLGVAEINEIAPDDLGEDVDLVEEDDEDSEEEEE